ncbi:hypothetical protein ISF_01841 [Cordyceps fumosorosea ARSEF 2679]|uniref:Uncharacterized protein n=1 Tax=Cordyceps fumosorosea (strain ARSEF 2679) TaxID=1081104 RepID=A0A168CES2_CORFA|nr:hypothetical protein ISF_01841 [Cordyceps fumosorosea ARSEF 2679]OAA71290.1 hypothetical protein ISF_01841 [Cordyceps fumosorosea ARSEF 2679]
MRVTRSMTLNERHNSNRGLLLLSNDLLLLIYLQAGSLDAVRALMRASRRLWATFNTNPVLIFESALAKSTPDRVAAVVRAVWNLRCRAHTPTITLRAMRSIDDPAHLPTWTPPPPLHPQVPAAFVRDFMALASRIHGLAHLILDDCLASLVSVQEEDKLSPFPMLYPEMQPSYPYKHGRAPWVDATPFLAPPSWAEELRMIHGLWLCEFHNALLEACARGYGWVCTELGGLAAGDRRLERFFLNNWTGTFWTIHHGLDALHRRHQAAAPTAAAELPLSMPIPWRLRPADAERARKGARGCWGAPPIAPGAMSWEEMLESGPETDGYRFLVGLSAGTAAAPVFAHLGVLHWCRSRMHSLGLVHGGDDRIPRIWYPRLLDHWLSLLLPQVRECGLALLPPFWWKMTSEQVQELEWRV